jgi:probable HAF family extracellular repeat protein
MQKTFKRTRHVLTFIFLFIGTNALAQVRFLDRAQANRPGAGPKTSPSVPPNRLAALGSGSVHIDGHVHSKNFAPVDDFNVITLPHWTSSFNYQNGSYSFTVMGSDPALGKTTTIPTVIIPYRLVFADGTVLDSSTDLVDGVTPVQGVLNSPIFNNVPWKFGNTAVGTTQFGDAFMRANFWSRHSDANDGYHVLLGTPTVAPVRVLQVPPDKGWDFIDQASGLPTANVDSEWLINQLVDTTVDLGITPETLPINLFTSIVPVTPAGLGYLGVHLAFNLSSLTGNPAIQTLIMTDYLPAKSRQRSNSAGTEVLGHEVLEWLNNPVGSNLVPVWQEPDRPHVCDNQGMEVADPLEVLSEGFQVTLNGRAYRLPDAAFFSWFAHINAPFSVNGWFSLLNTLTSPPGSCPVFDEYAYYTADIGDSTILTGLNDNFQVIGYTYFGDSLLSFRLNNSDPLATGTSTLDVVNVPGSLVTIPSKINNAGYVVGIFVDSAGIEHGFLWQNGNYTTIDFPGAVATEALGINSENNFKIVGDYLDQNGVIHGFLLAGNQFSTIDAPFAKNLSVTSINDHQKIAGIYDNGGLTGSFTGTMGSLSPLNYPDAKTSTSLNSLNNTDRLVGTTQKLTVTAQGPVLQTFALVAEDGDFHPLFPGYGDLESTQFLGNNNSNRAVGIWQDSRGVHGFFVFPFTLISNEPYMGTIGTMSIPRP